MTLQEAAAHAFELTVQFNDQSPWAVFAASTIPDGR